MTGSTISHYKILEKLGEGGMGVVFKAQDLTLDRIVALKFLPSHVSANEDTRTRFMQEAKAAAALNHNNICTIYGVESDESQMFIVMEYVDGGTLRDNMPFTRVDEAVNASIQIGEALQEAHSKGIVHRDVKADNIMMTSKGQVKIMDFGLAKLKGSLKLTRSSSTVGTLAYMAPEQIQGGEVDFRSDLFAFGVLLFEMLTGKLPFRGEHEAAMMYSILNEQPETIRKYIPDISSACERILDKSLEKNPEERYQSAADMVADLKRWKRDTGSVPRPTTEMHRPTSTQVLPPESSGGSSLMAFFASRTVRQVLAIVGVVIVLVAAFFVFRSSEPTSGKKTLAVLPFENQSDASKEYFADGITEEITTRLSSVSGLGVIARSSARAYKGTKKSISEIGGELGVEYVLMGTVRWSGQQVRISPELVNVNSGLQVWSQTLDASVSDAFSLQSNIATKVAGALDVKLLQPEAASLQQKLTTNPEAYDFYLQGVEYLNRSDTQGDYEVAIQLFNRAIKEDPSFAAAYAKLSYTHSNMYWFFFDRTEQRVKQSRDAAEKAISLAPNLSASHEAMAWYFYHGLLDYESALKEFAAALDLQPNNTLVYYGMGAVFRRQGRMRESIEAFQKSVEGNPRVADLIRQLAETMTLARQYEEADKTYGRSLALAPDFEDTFAERAKNIVLWKGDLQSARGIVNDGLRQGRIRQSEWLGGMDYSLSLMEGNFAGANNAVSRMEMEGINNQFVYSPQYLLHAQIEFLRGSKTRARAYFDSARVFLERRTREKPDDERLFSALGIAYAGLGRADDALREGEKGVAMLPVEKEAWRGAFRLTDLAQIHAMLGHQEKAMDLLERLILIPSELSPTYIRLDPTWNALRGNKRYEALVRPR